MCPEDIMSASSEEKLNVFVCRNTYSVFCQYRFNYQSRITIWRRMKGRRDDFLGRELRTPGEGLYIKKEEYI